MPDQPEPTDPVKPTQSQAIRPDPLFKDVTRRAALAAGLELLDIEFPQLLRADLVLAVPQGKDLSGTLFDFMPDFSILEFKSENDDFDRPELDRNLARALLFLSQNKGVEYAQLLTVFVCAERPDSVLDLLEREGLRIESDPATPWLLRSRFGLLRLAFVICRLLPLERRFYEWLLFAPATSQKWREFVRMLLRSGERAFLEQVKKLRLKEFRLMTIDIAEELKGLTPEQQAERKKDWLDLVKAEIDVLEELDPQMVNEVALKLNSQSLIAGLTPEKVANLTAEQRRRLLELLSQPDKKSEEES